MAEEYETGRSEDLAFWDEHSLNGQRVYSITCLIYGSDPDSFAELVGEDGLPAERAARCPGEYKQKSRAWDRLLAPHLAVVPAQDSPQDVRGLFKAMLDVAGDMV